VDLAHKLPKEAVFFDPNAVVVKYDVTIYFTDFKVAPQSPEQWD